MNPKIRSSATGSWSAVVFAAAHSCTKLHKLTARLLKGTATAGSENPSTLSTYLMAVCELSACMTVSRYVTYEYDCFEGYLC
jgi:hypothetical protein